MDRASFDRLTRTIHRLRHQTTRRQALRILAVGGLAGLLTRLETDEAKAACTRFWGRCSRDGECCRRMRCRRGRCRPRNDGGGSGESCGGSTCDSGWSCCKISGVSRCIDRDRLICCRSSICQKGGDCCRDGCCSEGWKCCGDVCCPKDWRCGRNGCIASRTADISAESAESTPFAEPVKGDERTWIKKGWMTAAGTE
jgi:hypothetical protein